MQENVRFLNEKIDRYAAAKQSLSDAIVHPKINDERTEDHGGPSEYLKPTDATELAKTETHPWSSTQHSKGTGKEKTKVRVELPEQPKPSSSLVPSHVTHARGKGKGKGYVTNNTSGKGFGRGGGKGVRQESNAPRVSTKKWGDRSEDGDSSDDGLHSFHDEGALDGRGDQTDSDDYADYTPSRTFQTQHTSTVNTPR